MAHKFLTLNDSDTECVATTFHKATNPDRLVIATETGLGGVVYRTITKDDARRLVEFITS